MRSHRAPASLHAYRTSPPSLRSRVREIMDPYGGGPDSTWFSLAMDVFIVLAILASCSLVVLEWRYPGLRQAGHSLEIAFTVLFLAEYLARWYSAKNPWIYPFTPLAFIDLVAILPGVLLIASDLLMLRLFRGARLLWLLRLFRLVRLLRLFRYGPLMQRGLIQARVWLSSLNYRYGLDSLGRLFLAGLAVLFLGANVLHITELAFGGEAGPFGDYQHAYWNTLIVIVSGIEDKEPVSLLGRLEVTLLLIAGLVIVGMLTAEIVSVFLRKVQRAGKVALKPPKSHFEQHIVILGINSHVDSVVREIYAGLGGQHHILVVDPHAAELTVTDPRVYKQVFALAGEPRETRVLEQADIDEAARVIVLTPDRPGGDDTQVDSVALMASVAVLCRRRAVPMVVQLSEQDSVRYTRGLPGADFVVAQGYGEWMISQAVLTPGVTEVYEELLTFEDQANGLFSIPTPEALVGKSFADAQLYFLDRDIEALTLVGVDRSPSNSPMTRVKLCPSAPEANSSLSESLLEPDDRLVVMAYPRPDRVASLGNGRLGSPLTRP